MAKTRKKLTKPAESSIKLEPSEDPPIVTKNHKKKRIRCSKKYCIFCRIYLLIPSFRFRKSWTNIAIANKVDQKELKKMRACVCIIHFDQVKDFYPQKVRRVLRHKAVPTKKLKREYSRPFIMMLNK